MKKVFISMPMNGKERFEIIQKQEKILNLAGKFLDEDLILVESYLSDEYKTSPLDCLAESLKRMNTADYVVFAEGYENARGCRVEYLCASEYGKKILVQNENEIQEIF